MEEESVVDKDVHSESPKPMPICHSCDRLSTVSDFIQGNSKIHTSLALILRFGSYANILLISSIDD